MLVFSMENACHPSHSVAQIVNHLNTFFLLEINCGNREEIKRIGSDNWYV
jgi:hypothetical protein